MYAIFMNTMVFLIFFTIAVFVIFEKKIGKAIRTRRGQFDFPLTIEQIVSNPASLEQLEIQPAKVMMHYVSANYGRYAPGIKNGSYFETFIVDQEGEIFDFEHGLDEVAIEQRGKEVAHLLKIPFERR